MAFVENPSGPPSDDMLANRIIEEELELQLGLLKSETPDSTLFPDDEMLALPNLKGEKKRGNPVEDVVHGAEAMAVSTESIMDEETMETVVICAAIAGLVFLPQLFQM